MDLDRLIRSLLSRSSNLPKCRASIDVGLKGTGIALWRDKGWNAFEPPIMVFSVKVVSEPDGDAKYARRCVALIEAIAARLDKINVRLSAAYIEHAEFHEAGKGLAAARSGSLVKLAILEGMLAAFVTQRIWGEDSQAEPYKSAENVHLIPPRVWKGQLAKRVCHDRLKKRFVESLDSVGEKQWDRELSLREMKAFDEHAWDAVGIGYFCKGYF